MHIIYALNTYIHIDKFYEKKKILNKVPSGHSYSVGVPITEQILINWSLSETPGNNGQSLYNSAIIQPTANISMGEL